MLDGIKSVLNFSTENPDCKCAVGVFNRYLCFVAFVKSLYRTAALLRRGVRTLLRFEEGVHPSFFNLTSVGAERESGSCSADDDFIARYLYGRSEKRADARTHGGVVRDGETFAGGVHRKLCDADIRA